MHKTFLCPGRDRAGGYKGSDRIKFCLGYHQNWGIFQGVWLFQTNISAKKTVPPPPPPKSCFENTMGNTFFDFYKYGPKRSKFFNRIVGI